MPVTGNERWYQAFKTKLPKPPNLLRMLSAQRGARLLSPEQLSKTTVSIATHFLFVCLFVCLFSTAMRTKSIIVNCYIFKFVCHLKPNSIHEDVLCLLSKYTINSFKLKGGWASSSGRPGTRGVGVVWVCTTNMKKTAWVH